MELSIAKGLLAPGVEQTVAPHVWADLGAGDGLFTRALAELLPSKSRIVAVDRDERALKNISVKSLGTEIQTIVADLNSLPESFNSFNGIVMANSLHYIKDQTSFLTKMKKDVLGTSGVLILIEYNLEKSNAWVPYPISKRRLSSVAADAGFDFQIFPNSIKSKLNSSEIYSACLKPKA